jgi:hypothetical protein
LINLILSAYFIPWDSNAVFDPTDGFIRRIGEGCAGIILVAELENQLVNTRKGNTWWRQDAKELILKTRQCHNASWRLEGLYQNGQCTVQEGRRFSGDKYYELSGGGMG